MKKKASKPLVRVNKKVHVVHLNVGSGYVTYLEEDCSRNHVVVKGIPLETPRRRKSVKV